jgi:putative ABC transport system ATP-binding protein
MSGEMSVARFETVISLIHISKTYTRGDGARVNALKDVSLKIEEGEFLALRGVSGSGKSSLLNIIGCLDRPTEGSAILNGTDLADRSDRELSVIRARSIGFIFQSFHLLPRLTAAENVELPLLYAGGHADRGKALALLARVGLAQRAGHFPTELSGGEQQRVAVARALINKPPVILADEPTGNLDSAAGGEVMQLLKSLHEEGRTIVLVTHDDVLARVASRQVSLADGILVGGNFGVIPGAADASH